MTLAILRAEKEGKIDGGRGGRNRLALQVCRGREGPGEQVEGNKTARAGRKVEASGSGRLYIWPGNPRPEEKGIIGC